MSRIDAQNEMSDAQAVTATALSTNVIDLTQAIPQYSGGEDLFVTVKVNTAFAGGTSIQPKLWTDDTTTVTDGVNIVAAPAVLTAAATAGTSILRVNLKGVFPALQRYLGMQYVIVGTMSAGKVDAFLEVTPSVDAPNLS